MKKSTDESIVIVSKDSSGIVFDMPTCGGCGTCEMACSFHHIKEFRPSVSSLQILDKEDSRGYMVRFEIEGLGQRLACDGCKDQKVPLCVQYCKSREELEAMIEEVVEGEKPSKKL